MRRSVSRLLSGCAAGAAMIVTALAALEAQPAPGLRDIDRLREYRFGPDRAMLDAAAQVVKESLGSPSRRAEVADALAWVASSGAAFDARQFACRQLVYVASADQIPAMVRLLGDEVMAHYALMVLDRIPGPEVGDALRSAVPGLKGKALAGALDLLGQRSEPASVPVLHTALTGSDADIAQAAATALGKLGLRAADDLLMKERSRASGKVRQAIDEALLARADALAEAGRRAEAARIAAHVLESGDAGTAAPIRAAALRVLALARGASAVPDLLAGLDSPDREVSHMAAAVLREMPVAAVIGGLARGAKAGSSRSRALIADALGDRGDPAAETALLGLLSDPDVNVRSRAIAAIGKVGGAASVGTLLSRAGADDAERQQAAAALRRLRGAGVDRALVAAMDDTAPTVQGGAAATPALRRGMALTALFERGADIPKDRLMRMATSEAGPTREAALSTLRQIGEVGDVGALIGALLKAPEADRDGLSDTIVAIARRDGAGAPQVVRALLQAATPALRATLLACAGQIGGPEALNALIEAASDTDAEIQITALRALSEWPDVGPMGTLLKVAQSPPSSRARAVALRGYLRMLRLPGGDPLADAPRLYRAALDLARSDDEKRLVLSGLASIGSRDALAMARSLADSPDLSAEAEQAMLSIAHMTAGAWPTETRDALRFLAREASSQTEVRAKASELLATMERFGDFAMVWEVSPAYEREATNFSALFDMAFPPEAGASDGDIGWRVMPVGTAPEQPWLLDLLALYGGEQKVAYLRTVVWSPTEQDLIVEVGTDDGPKLWWNGEVVLANNTQRAVAPNQDRANVRARAGRNSVLLKVTQNIMGWGACVRFTDREGKPAAGLRLALPSFANEGER